MESHKNKKLSVLTKVAAMAPQVAMELSSGSYKSMWYYYQEDQH
jgi:hypothetical protein